MLYSEKFSGGIRGVINVFLIIYLTYCPPSASILGNEMVARLMPLVGGGRNVQAFGKSAIVGVSGEIEHGSALIHTLWFGNFLRDAELCPA